MFFFFFFLLFFFQAEDGIRDVAVTGVQTCALPISMNIYDNAFSLVVSRVLYCNNISPTVGLISVVAFTK